METNYEVKPKKSLRPLKAGLLVLAMVCFVLGTFAQQVQTVKVASNQELLQALENPSTKALVFESSFQGYSIIDSPAVLNALKSKNGGGNRALDCVYFIQESDVCWEPDSLFNDTLWSFNYALAGNLDPFNCLCCPDTNTGTWSWNTTNPDKMPPPGSNLHFLNATNLHGMNFMVNLPGVYTLRYYWGLPFNSYVQTEYKFYDEFEIDLSAPDTCGLTTEVSMYIESYYREGNDTIRYYLVNECTGDSIDVLGPDLEDFSYIPPANTWQEADFLVTAPYHGVWKFCAHIYEIPGTDTVCLPVTECIYIDFSLEPMAYAGEDAEICEDLCYTLMGSTGIWEICSMSPNFYYTWMQISGPAQLTFVDANDDTTVVCRDSQVCSYGEYIIAFNVTNGECFDSDTVALRFYEQPTAQAGENAEYCFTEACFSMMGTAYSYCSDPITSTERYRKWTKIGGPAAVTFSDETDPHASVCPDEEADCIYGWYTFEWLEVNGTCEARDTVEITLYEPPIADAGEDAEYCLDREYSFSLWHTLAALPYTYCQETGFEEPYGYWSKCGGPGYVTFVDESDPFTAVHVSAFGCYCFEWHEVNGECESVDTVNVCWYEHPYLDTLDLYDSTCTELCYDLGVLGLVPYEYLPAPNVNYNVQYWTKIAGAGDPIFTSPTGIVPPESDPEAEVCVDEYGCYTFAFIQYNGDEDCADTAFAYLWFFENPVADAGDDAELCGNCYMMTAIPYSYVENECAPAEDQAAYWAWFSYIPPADPCPDDYYDLEYMPSFTVIGGEWDNPEAEICVEDSYCGIYHGMYGFEWIEHNGTCEERDTVWIDFNKKPDPLPLRGWYTPENFCSPYGNLRPLNQGINFEWCNDCYLTCLYPEDTVLKVCAESCISFSIDWPCMCEDMGSQVCDCGPIPGWTYEWSFTGPAGSFFEADPLWWDCDAECWRGSDQVNICFGECCDTARLYLTITTPEGCVTTEEWKFYVEHRPDATISGPEVAEVSSVFEYTIPEPQNPCYLYIWEVQHCGEIVYGQGTGTIGVHWTDYNVNGGWGLVYVEVHDTCTGCCATDSLWVKVYPTGTIGDDTLSGHVYYHNNIQTPLNGVELTLWNAGIPVATTTSFNDIEGGNGVGYYEFAGINGTTEFVITASYGAPWYGANATDALAVELKVVNSLPGSFVWDDLVAEAMDVNNSASITATDALWIKQRAINMIGYFPAGNWVFEVLSASAGDSPYDIMTLNAGDANRSNIPASMKEAPAIAMVTDGVMNVELGQEYELPIRIAESSTFGAITLTLGYNPALVEVVDVVTMEGMLSSIADGNVSIAWSSVNPMALAENDVVVTLKVKALSVTSASDELFTIGLGSEFADASAKVIEPVTLKTYGISTDPAAADYFLSANRPNPFSTSTFIEYTLPETGKVRLSVLDMLGQEIAVLVESTQSAGSYTVEFANPGLATGVYIYKITVDGESRDYVSTQRMVITH